MEGKERWAGCTFWAHGSALGGPHVPLPPSRDSREKALEDSCSPMFECDGGGSVSRRTQEAQIMADANASQPIQNTQQHTTVKNAKASMKRPAAAIKRPAAAMKR